MCGCLFVANVPLVCALTVEPELALSYACSCTDKVSGLHQEGPIQKGQDKVDGNDEISAKG